MALAVPGALLLRRMPRHPVAWILGTASLHWGGVVFGAALAMRVAEFFAGSAALSEPFPQLTAREREILELLAAGRSNAQIASTLYLSPKTVRNNVSNVFAKLQVADRSEAIIRAREAGLGG